MDLQTSHSARTFVLVHGVNHGGWCFSRVAERLRAQGHQVFTPTLSGLAERSDELDRAINLSTHIRDILDLFEWGQLDDVVLCGHSYGGMVIGGVADQIPEKIHHLVFLDAAIPENGKSMCDYVFPGEELLVAMEHVSTLGAGITCPPPPAAFFNVNEADRDMVDRLLSPHPMASLLEKSQVPVGCTWEAVKSHTFVHGTNWGHPSIVRQYERAKTLAGWKVFEVEAGHDVMLDAPDRVVEILSGLD